MKILTPGLRTTEFWSHLAVLVGGAGTALGTVFDHGFLDAHPVFAGIVAAVGMLCAGIATFAYSVSRGLAKQGTGDGAPTLLG